MSEKDVQPVAWRIHPFDYGIGVDGAYAITQLAEQRDVWIRKGWNVAPLYTHPPAADVQPVGYFNGEFGSHDGNRIWFKVIASDAIPTAGSAIYAKELVCDWAAKDMPFGRCCKAPNFSTCKSKLQVDQWNINIRNSVDKLLEQAGFAPDSSVRHQLAMMKLSEGKIK